MIRVYYLLQETELDFFVNKQIMLNYFSTINDR